MMGCLLLYTCSQPAAAPERRKELNGDSVSAAQIPAADTLYPCCEYSTCDWAALDSLESYLPPLNELAPTTNQAIRNLRKKQKEVRQNEIYRRQFHFPDNCIVYEYAELKTKPARAIAIVVENPKVFIDFDENYTCPAEVTGFGYLCGKARFLLLDPGNRTVVDTAPEMSYEEPFFEPGCRNLPFSICRGYSYRSNGTREREGVARILSFSDFDRDGLAAEFPIFDPGSCGFVFSAILGYDAATDKLAPLVFHFNVTEEDWENTRNGQDTLYAIEHDWMPNLPFEALLREDTFCYTFFAGHGMVTGERFNIWFDNVKKQYDGTLRIVSEKNLFGGGGPFFGGGGTRGY